MVENIVFFGPPGCGKGTQAQLLVEAKKYITVSTGELLRKIVDEESELGKNITSTLDEGALVSDEIVNSLIDNFYNENKSATGIILDGYPRSVDQANSLELILEKYKTKIDKVFYFDVSEDTLLKRITGRYTCSECGAIYNRFFSDTKVSGECDKCHSVEFDKRSDDSKEVIVNRLKVFKELTSPLLEFYKDKLVKIDGEQSTNLILESVLSHL
jgi:adenylate kinase